MLSTRRGSLASVRARPLPCPSLRICAPARDTVAAAGRGFVTASPPRGSDPEVLRLKLNKLLEGKSGGSRRVKVTTTKVTHVSRAGYSHNPLSRKPRCGRLDLDIAWEAEGRGPGKATTPEPLQGLARVTLTTSGGSDQVSINDIQVLGPADEDNAPRMPSAQPPSPDVLLAVKSMDSVIMSELNDFMWELESSQDFPLASLECEDEESESQAVLASR